MSAPPAAPASGKLMAVHQGVLMALGIAMVGVVLLAVLRGSQSYLLLPLAGMGVAVAVTGALLPRIVTLRHRNFELQADDRRRRDDR